MMTHHPPPRAAGRIMLAAIAASVAAVLAACGSASAGGPGGGHHSGNSHPGSRAVPGVRLCQEIPRLTRVQISRASGMSTANFHEVLPAGITISDPAKAQALARVLCSLPPMPSGSVNCPADFGGGLRFGFATTSRGFPPVTVHLTGCRTVTGLGPARWWIRTPALAGELTRLLGMKAFGKNGSVPTP
jgi:hypothetical protein